MRSLVQRDADDCAARIQAAHETVWGFRRDYQQKWPTPTTDDNPAFALTEVGEAITAAIVAAAIPEGSIVGAVSSISTAIDALLRSKRYNRNNARAADVERELADVAMMVLTALGPAVCDFYDTAHARAVAVLGDQEADRSLSMDNIVFAGWMIATAFLSKDENGARREWLVQAAVHLFLLETSKPLGVLIAERLQRIEQRINREENRDAK